jgi:hypothetical protein
MNTYTTCPFCGEGDFDTVGLKSHLMNHCEEFDKVETPLQEFRRKCEERSR